MFVYLLLTEGTPTSNTAFTLWAEYVLQEFAFFLKIILEFIAILMIAIALVQAMRKVFRTRRQHRNVFRETSIRLDLGLSLALSLEFLLAADIVGTAVSPRWDEIGQLAAIAGIRTFLNYFLQKEVKELQDIPHAAAELKRLEE